MREALDGTVHESVVVCNAKPHHTGLCVSSRITKTAPPPKAQVSPRNKTFDYGYPDNETWSFMRTRYSKDMATTILLTHKPKTKIYTVRWKSTKDKEIKIDFDSKEDMRQFADNLAHALENF